MALKNGHADWMDNLAWLRERARAIRKRIDSETDPEPRPSLFQGGAQQARIDALSTIEGRIDVLEHFYGG